MIEFAPKPTAQIVKEAPKAAPKSEPVVEIIVPAMAASPVAIDMAAEPTLLGELPEALMPSKLKTTKPKVQRKPKASAEVSAIQLALEA